MTDIEIARRAAKEAGKRIRSIRPDDAEVTTKADDSPVTRADREASDIIHDILLSETPHGVIDEERGVTRPEQETVWIVDPLDGTKEFIKGAQEYTVNIALVTDGSPVGGAVYVPATDIMYHAEGDEAWCDDQRLAPSDAELEDATVAVSTSHPDEALNDFLSEAGVGALRGVGSSLKGCRVAAGELNAYPRFQELYSWDVAAMHAVLEGAGCRMTTWEDERILHGDGRIPGFVAAPPGLHRAFLDAREDWAAKHS
jgi:3'(2'), 5'-bisphosphate nucleotidase